MILAFSSHSRKLRRSFYLTHRSVTTTRPHFFVCKIFFDIILFWLKSFTSINLFLRDLSTRKQHSSRFFPLEASTFAEFLGREPSLLDEVESSVESPERSGERREETIEEKIPARRSNFGGARRRLATRPYARVRASKLKRREKAGFRATRQEDEDFRKTSASIFQAPKLDTTTGVGVHRGFIVRRYDASHLIIVS